MENTQKINISSDNYFYFTIKKLYSQAVLFKEWNLYYNLLRGSMEGGLSLEHTEEFATALDNAIVIIKGETENNSYKKAKIYLNRTIEHLNDLKKSREENIKK